MITLTDKITVRLVQKAGGDHFVVAAAKVSVSGEEALRYAEIEEAEGCRGLIGYLMRNRHGTPFEHGMATFFVHAPIFVWREWHRHRIGFSFNEESARYKQLDPVFWVPAHDRKLVPAPDHKSSRPSFKMASNDEHVWLVQDLVAGYEDAYRRYQDRIDRGYAKEVARAGLPVGIYSSCWVTANPRSIMAFLSLRTHEPTATFPSRPQAEIEQAARVVEEIFSKGWPITYAAFNDNGRVGP